MFTDEIQVKPVFVPNQAPTIDVPDDVQFFEDNRYDVFVEIERNIDLPKNIMELVRDIEQVTGMLPWKFSFYKNQKQFKLSEQNLTTIIPTSASQYTFLTDDKVEEDIAKFFESAPIIHKRINGKNIILKKAYTKHEMVVEAFDHDVQGTYKIDRESSEQSSYLNHWLGGGYSIVKVDDLFKITKGSNFSLKMNKPTIDAHTSCKNNIG